jgi:8-oxo-dGTP pyrophosphatase MutT (NUDIX family)
LGEQPDDALMREINEEITVKIQLERELYRLKESGLLHHFYLCSYISGVPHLKLNSDEAGQGEDNTFKPTWVKIDELAKMEHPYWTLIFNELLIDIKTGFMDNVKILG